MADVVVIEEQGGRFGPLRSVFGLEVRENVQGILRDLVSFHAGNRQLFDVIAKQALLFLQRRGFDAPDAGEIRFAVRCPRRGERIRMRLIDRSASLVAFLQRQAVDPIVHIRQSFSIPITLSPYAPFTITSIRYE